jgi:hypothetical protein
VFVKLFGFVLVAGILFTSVAMMVLGGRWQKIEAGVYAGNRRPVWFWLVSALVVALYIAALIDFINGPRNWASWILMVVIPVGWILKGAAVIFNKQGRQTVSNIAGDEAWVKIGLMRLPIAVVLGVLATFA